MSIKAKQVQVKYPLNPVVLAFASLKRSFLFTPPLTLYNSSAPQPTCPPLLLPSSVPPHPLSTACGPSLPHTAMSTQQQVGVLPDLPPCKRPPHLRRLSLWSPRTI